MTFTRAEAYAPASMGNVGVGFDILGMAYEAPGDTVIAEFDETAQGVYMKAIEGDEGKLPLTPSENCASVAAQALLDQLGDHRGIALTLKKGLPLASGMGSSAASAVAAVAAVNALLGSPLSILELLPACLEGERLVSGYHADNVAPSLLGGIVLCADPRKVRVLPVPSNMYIALVTPDVEVKTSEARAVLPANVPLKTMICMMNAVGELVDALYREDIEAVAKAMEKDCVIEPARAHLMPKMAEVREAAKQAGALSMVISGAGPTLAAICDGEERAETVRLAMRDVYESVGIDVTISQRTRVPSVGAVVSVS